MKLLRYNQEPIDINPLEVDSIDAGNNILKVYLTDGSHYVGYLLKKES